MENNLIKMLGILTNLNEIRNKIKKEIFSSVCDAENDHDINLLLDRDDISSAAILSYLTGAGYITCESIEKQPQIDIPTIDININTFEISIRVPINNEDAFIASASNADYDTKQISLGYLCGDDFFDLALAEIKKGELARAHKLPIHNRDIDMYIYGNPYDEDYTEHKYIKYADIKSVINDNQR